MLRHAGPEDLLDLLELERAASLAGLGHVFARDRHPYPDDDVLARWALLLEEPGCEVLLEDTGVPGDSGDPSAGLVALAAYDDVSLRHLAVRPDQWGQGHATRLVAAVIDALTDRGCPSVSLWCLVGNARARRLYEHLGWVATADRRETPWPPYPAEMRYERALTPGASGPASP